MIPLLPVALLLTDPQTLTALEAAGLDVGAVAFGSARASDNAALAKDPGYASVVATFARDLHELYDGDKAWGVGMRFAHRGFDVRWLTSPDTRWELAAVVNRVDRRVFTQPASSTCGEVRLIYRLAGAESRLPATLNAVYFLPPDPPNGRAPACVAAAARFAPPLTRAILDGATLKSVEIDVQSVRWPSTVRPDLGGHAEYVLRVFKRPRSAPAPLAPAPLEDVPDVARIAADPALKRELLAFVRAHADDVNAGTLVVPERFLASRAVSVTPHGLARTQNRPWTRLFTVDDVRDFAGASPPAFLRRLDGLTCMGCHQSRSIAGFHIVGEERRVREADALALGVSPHLEEDLPRRRAYVDAVLAGLPVDERRRAPEHEIDRGRFGDACGLGDAGFAAWACAPGFACAPVDDDVVGQCMPTAPAVGSACKPAPPCAPDDVCEGVPVGFPGGMCAAPCESTRDHARCGAIAILTPFNECLARGRAFASCARENSRPASLRACGAEDPCRPDYICAQPGVCLPPYFVLQMRVDGHVTP